MDRTGAKRADQARDLSVGQDRQTNFWVGRARDGLKVLRRNKFDLYAFALQMRFKGLMRSNNAIDLREPRVGDDKESHVSSSVAVAA